MEKENKERDVIFTTPAQEEPVSPSPKETEGEDAQAAGSSQPSGQPGEGEEQPSEPDLRYKNGKEVAKGGVLGFFIGLAVIVPGVSGSTVAIIFRLYDKLLYALGNIVRRFRACIKFLLPIAIGLVVGFILGFLAIQRLINISPFAIIGLFAGLMVGSFPAV